MCVCCVCTPECSAHGGQQRASDAQELELQNVMRLWLLTTKLDVFYRTSKRWTAELLLLFCAFILKVPWFYIFTYAHSFWWFILVTKLPRLPLLGVSREGSSTEGRPKVNVGCTMLWSGGLGWIKEGKGKSQLSTGTNIMRQNKFSRKSLLVELHSQQTER